MENNTDSKIVYTGIFLDISDDERQDLLSRFSKVYDVLHFGHLTLEFRPQDVSQVPFGKEVLIRVIGQIEAEGVQVFAADPDTLGVPCSNNVPHITVATKKGVSAFHANSVLKNYRDHLGKSYFTCHYQSSTGFPAEFDILGRVGAYLEDGRVVYENEWDS